MNEEDMIDLAKAGDNEQEIFVEKGPDVDIIIVLPKED